MFKEERKPYVWRIKEKYDCDVSSHREYHKRIKLWKKPNKNLWVEKYNNWITEFFKQSLIQNQTNKQITKNHTNH